MNPLWIIGALCITHCQAMAFNTESCQMDPQCDIPSKCEDIHLCVITECTGEASCSCASYTENIHTQKLLQIFKTCNNQSATVPTTPPQPSTGDSRVPSTQTPSVTNDTATLSGSTTDSTSAPSCNDTVTAAVLGVTTGVLVIALLVMVIVLIWVCRRKTFLEELNSQLRLIHTENGTSSHQQSPSQINNNAINPQTAQQATTNIQVSHYSSLGPTYEEIEQQQQLVTPNTSHTTTHTCTTTEEAHVESEHMYDILTREASLNDTHTRPVENNKCPTVGKPTSDERSYATLKTEYNRELAQTSAAGDFSCSPSVEKQDVKTGYTSLEIELLTQPQPYEQVGRQNSSNPTNTVGRVLASNNDAINFTSGTKTQDKATGIKTEGESMAVDGTTQENRDDCHLEEMTKDFNTEAETYKQDGTRDDSVDHDYQVLEEMRGSEKEAEEYETKN